MTSAVSGSSTPFQAKEMTSGLPWQNVAAGVAGVALIVIGSVGLHFVGALHGGLGNFCLSEGIASVIMGSGFVLNTVRHILCREFHLERIEEEKDVSEDVNSLPPGDRSPYGKERRAYQTYLRERIRSYEKAHPNFFLTSDAAHHVE